MLDRGYTKGAPYILTHVEDVGERQRELHYLFPDGSRRRVVIDVSHDSIHIRATIGASLARGEKEYR